MPETIFCAIPARGGSKRLPRKNVRQLANKPLIAYSIEVARNSGLFSSAYVCTDDEEIAQVALRLGARVDELVPAELCGDLVPSHVPCRYVMQKTAQRTGETFNWLLCLQPTSPLRDGSDLHNAVRISDEAECDFVVSVTPLDPHDFHWAVVPEDDGNWKMFFGSQYMKERPLLPPVYRPNGSIKLARVEALDRFGHFFGTRMKVVETPPERSVHVATEFDLRLCECLLAGGVR